jgi:hypothetical protein
MTARSRPSARWVLPVVLVVMIATAAGAVVARQLYTTPESSAAVLPDERSVPADQQPGSPVVVSTKDAADHPLYETVRALLQTNFDAINGKHYDQWRSVVTDRRGKNQPEKDWLAAYRSTRDGTIVVRRIESGPADNARVLVSFTSLQDVNDAPQELQQHCIRWWVILPLIVEDGAWKIDSGPTNTAPQHETC